RMQRSVVLGVAMGASFWLGSWTSHDRRPAVLAENRAAREQLVASKPPVEPRLESAPPASAPPVVGETPPPVASANVRPRERPNPARKAAGRSELTGRSPSALFDVENPYDAH